MNFCFGFYNELNNLKTADADADFGFLENVDVTSESNAYDFLHGCCEEFAAMLADAYGYEIECVRNANNRLIHAYCISYIGDEKTYIDVRGITTDKVLFFKEFEDELTYCAERDSFTVVNEDGYELGAIFETWSGKSELFHGEFAEWEDSDIERFIADNSSYYDSNRFASVFICKECSKEFVAEDDDHEWFYTWGEEDLWGHLQMEHPEIFEENQTLETPDMVEIFYEHVIRSRGAVAKRLDQVVSDVEKARRENSALNGPKNETDKNKSKYDFER